MISFKSKNIVFSSIVWNTLAGMMIAGQSAVLLLFVSYRSDLETAGIISIAYASANLFYAAAHYGVRNFQVTDITIKYAFTDYLYARAATVLSVFAVLCLYLLFAYAGKGYSVYKSVIVFEIVVWKLTDAFEDVFIGRYQQTGRLDIGAKIMTLRLAVSTGLVCLLVLLEAKIWAALLAGIVVSVAIDIWCIRSTFFLTHTPEVCCISGKSHRVLIECFPLCVGATLSIYIGNVPKYLIDKYLDEQTQAVFGYLMMPVFVITLLSSFIYQPFVKNLGEFWKQGRIAEFRQKVMIQCIAVAVITICMVCLGILFGLPVLSILYHTELSGYKKEFLVMMSGGGFYTLAVYLSVSLTAVRKQQMIAAGNLICVFLSVISGKEFITRCGMTGAAIVYLVISAVLAFWHLLVLLYAIKKGVKTDDEG